MATSRPTAMRKSAMAAAGTSARGGVEDNTAPAALQASTLLMRNFPKSWTTAAALADIGNKVKKLLATFGQLTGEPKVISSPGEAVLTNAIFQDPSEAQKAVTALHGVDMRTAKEKRGAGGRAPLDDEKFWVQIAPAEDSGSRPRVSFTSEPAGGDPEQGDTYLQVKGFPPSWTEAHLKMVFLTFGSLGNYHSVIIKAMEGAGKSRSSYGKNALKAAEHTDQHMEDRFFANWSPLPTLKLNDYEYREIQLQDFEQIALNVNDNISSIIEDYRAANSPHGPDTSPFRELRQTFNADPNHDSPVLPRIRVRPNILVTTAKTLQSEKWNASTSLSSLHSLGPEFRCESLNILEQENHAEIATWIDYKVAHLMEAIIVTHYDNHWPELDEVATNFAFYLASTGVSYDIFASSHPWTAAILQKDFMDALQLQGRRVYLGNSRLCVPGVPAGVLVCWAVCPLCPVFPPVCWFARRCARFARRCARCAQRCARVKHKYQYKYKYEYEYKYKHKYKYKYEYEYKYKYKHKHKYKHK
ncbi:unnamed protein product [Polarella glacialis]|uniref:Uncharacterized protein n=1 Tax=Polarella glacialis TaxID=89957 RepID=A0A813JPQ6_POLGL|nr:unnamed protein product [Polarella glacialis]